MFLTFEVTCFIRLHLCLVMTIINICWLNMTLGTCLPIFWFIKNIAEIPATLRIIFT